MRTRSRAPGTATFLVTARRSTCAMTLSSVFQRFQRRMPGMSASGTGAMVVTSVSTLTCFTARVRKPTRSTVRRPYSCSTSGA